MDANDRISIGDALFIISFTQHVLDQELPSAFKIVIDSLINDIWICLNFGTTAVEGSLLWIYRTKLKD